MRQDVWRCAPLRDLRGEAIAAATTWFSGRPFPSSQNKVLQLGWAVLRDALGTVGKVEETALHEGYLKHSDIGEVAFELLQARQIESSLSVEQVNALFHKLQAARGPVAKTRILTDALQHCTALEAKYLVF